jgi:hypothetical protein
VHHLLIHLVSYCYLPSGHSFRCSCATCGAAERPEINVRRGIENYSLSKGTSAKWS